MVKVKAIELTSSPLKVTPGHKKRQWMDDSQGKSAYRCLPLQIANTFGWDIYAPCDFIVTWDGGDGLDSMQVNFASEVIPFCHSSFGTGIFTIHTGYLFKTDPGWDMMCTGPVNEIITFASPITGIVETNWLNFTFTINWKLHKAGSYQWNCNIPVARIFPIPHNYEIEVERTTLSENPEIEKEYTIWCNDRSKKIDDLHLSYKQEKTVGTVEHGKPSTEWERTYYTGKDKYGNVIDNHITNRKFPEF